MNLYEHTIIAKQDISPSQIKQLIEKYSKIVEKLEGNLVKTENWGLLNLSYIINKNRKGNYIHFKIKGESKIVSELEKGATDFVCLNFANPDMVGHTGDYNAIKKAVETVDNCTRKVVEEGLKNDYAFIIIADHGNADFAINEDGSPNTAHSTNLVPCFALNTGFEKIENGKLGDIAPTILKIMGVEIPTEMTGEILIK